MNSQELQRIIAARDEILRRSAALGERAARLTALKAERDQAQAEINALMRADAASLSAWAHSGASGKPPAPDTRSREAAVRKLAAAEQSAQSVDAALAELERENTEISREVEVAQQQVRTATARYLAQLHREHMAEQRALEDRLDVSRAICAGIYQQVSSNDQRVAGEVANVAEAERAEWLNRRNGHVQAAVAEQWAKFTAILPAA